MLRPKKFYTVGMVVTGFLVLAWTSEVSQGQRATATRGPSTTSTPGHSATPFSLEVDSLPKSYIGMDCVKVVAALKPLPVLKSQFETTAAYDQRIAAIVEGGLLYGSLRMSDTLAFKIILRGGSYDADKGVMTITWGELPSAIWGPEPNYAKWYETVAVTQSVTSTYVGTTVFGVKGNVQRVTDRVCGVMNGEKAEWVASRPLVGTTFPMSSRDAQSFLKQPGVLLVGKLESPLYLVGRDFRDHATLHVPADRHTTVDGIVLTLAEMWFYDVPTGRVYYRQRLNKF